MDEGSCPECGAHVHFRRPPRLGQRARCPKCGARLEVVGTVPVELDWAFDAPLDQSWRMGQVLTDDEVEV
jgi:lysine biosynthesis protein LysW